MTVSRRTLLIGSASALVGAAAAVVAGGVAFAAVGASKFTDRFYPGVRFDGEDVAGLTYAEALARLRTRWDPYLASPVILRLKERLWTPRADDVGVRVDYERPLRAAFAYGHTGDLGGRLQQQRTSLEAPLEWRTEIAFDPYVFSSYVERITQGLDKPAKDALLVMEDRGGRRQIVVRPSEPGVKLVPPDVMAVFGAPSARPERLVIDLTTIPLKPTIATEMLLPVVKKAESLVQGQIAMVGPEGTWTISRDQLLADLALTGPQGNPSLTYDLRYQAFEPLAREIASQHRIDPIEPRIRVNREGGIVPKVQGKPGRRVDVEELWSRVRAAATTGASEIEIPIVIIQPDIARLSARDLQFDRVIATGTSFYYGSQQNRIHNIANGSGLIDGTVVAPGEEFSFNATLGPVTFDNGFVEGFVIHPDKTEKEVGGGLCQVSTTLFRAVFWAGLPIVERWEHAYRVGYYEQGADNPVGFDAAVWQPSQDLKFLNDTPNYILIRRNFDPSKAKLEFTLYGPPNGRKVERQWWRGPTTEPGPVKVVASEKLKPGEIKQTDTAVAGVQAIVYRQVTLGGRVLIKDKFLSLFRPWAERWEIGPNPDGTFDVYKIPNYKPEEGKPIPGTVPTKPGAPGAPTATPAPGATPAPAG
ncbi:MAG: VanW family protein [Actinobacteria bacterium]|nr:VanW family protein [Actinomycetota bacterium]